MQIRMMLFILGDFSHASKELEPRGEILDVPFPTNELAARRQFPFRKGRQQALDLFSGKCRNPSFTRDAMLLLQIDGDGRNRHIGLLESRIKESVKCIVEPEAPVCWRL